MADKSWEKCEKIQAEKHKKAKEAQEAMKIAVTRINEVCALTLPEFETAEKVDTLYGFSPIHPTNVMDAALQYMARIGGKNFARMQVGYFDLHKAPDFVDAIKQASVWTTKLKPSAKDIL